MTDVVLNADSPRPAAAYAVAVVMVLFHLGALGALLVGASVPAVTAAIVMYVIRAFGITAGYHRLLSHRSFQTSRFVQFLFALAGSLAIQGGPLWWVAHHRSHHRHTEMSEDIHSPRQHGFWQSHMGWMMSAGAFKEQGANSRDLHKYPELKWLQRNYVLLILLEAAALYGLGEAFAWLAPEWGTSGLQMLVWGLFVSTVPLWHATFMVNSVCHIWGSRPNHIPDDSTNNPLVAIVAFGEGWHNNHHAFPYSARHGLEWWQLDLTWLLLKTLEKLGLVHNLKVVKPGAMPLSG